MVRVGCTGGIGSGKSSVCALLAAHGARIIDVDKISRSLTALGGPAFPLVLDSFGEAILTSEGAIDRAALARIVFSDRDRLRELETIIHPLVNHELLREVANEDGAGIVVIDHPLLVETNARDLLELDGVLVVDAPVDFVIERLVEHRQMSREDVEARIAAQCPREDRLRAADFILMNMGTFEELTIMADRAWQWIETLQA